MLSRQALCSLLIGALALSTLNACGKKPKPRTVVEEEEESSDGSKSGGDDLDHWDEQYALVKSKAPDLDKGAAVVVRFVNEKKGTKISLVYLTTDAPQYKDQIDSRVLIAKATGKNDKVLSTVTIIVKNWEPGHYPCSTGGDVVAMSHRTIGDVPIHASDSGSRAENMDGAVSMNAASEGATRRTANGGTDSEPSAMSAIGSPGRMGTMVDVV